MHSIIGIARFLFVHLCLSKELLFNSHAVCLKLNNLNVLSWFLNVCGRQYGDNSLWKTIWKWLKLMMYNSLYNNVLVLNCEKADLTTNKINGSTNILFYNTVLIHYTLRTKREVETATYSLSHPFRWPVRPLLWPMRRESQPAWKLSEGRDSHWAFRQTGP